MCEGNSLMCVYGREGRRHQQTSWKIVLMLLENIFSKIWSRKTESPKRGTACASPRRAAAVSRPAHCGPCVDRRSSSILHTHMDTTSAFPSLYCMMNGWPWRRGQAELAKRNTTLPKRTQIIVFSIIICNVWKKCIGRCCTYIDKNTIKHLLKPVGF